MGDYSHSQPVFNGIFLESRSDGGLCDISQMQDVVKIHAIRERVESEMAAKGFSKRSLSAASGLNESAIRDLLTRTVNPGIGTLRKIAEALDLPFDALTGAGLEVPLLGKIGAGGAIIFSIDPDDEERDIFSQTVPRPPLVAGRLMALEVVGDSMLPKYETGDVIYVRRDHDGILPDYIDQYCAVRTSSGATYLKILSMGATLGRYTLRSLNAADMVDQEVLWASPVLFIMPRRSRF